MIRKMTRQEFIEHVIPSHDYETSKRLGFLHSVEEMLRRQTKATAIVLFENINMCSSNFGFNKALAVGPGLTFPSVESCEGKWLNDLPSVRLYPIAWVPRDEMLQDADLRMSGVDMMPLREDEP